MNMKPIETVYNSYRFRSRLEARWAVFFDTAGIEYRYEPEGFDLDGIWYLPDFYLPRFKTWIEIKPTAPTPEEREKVMRLCASRQEEVFILSGDVWSDVRVFGFMPIQGLNRDDIEDLFGKDEDQVLYWLTTEEGILSACKSPSFSIINLQHQIYGYPTQWDECVKCGQIALGKWCDCYSPKPLTDRVLTAFTAARQARFEHGESHQANQSP